MRDGLNHVTRSCFGQSHVFSPQGAEHYCNGILDKTECETAPSIYTCEWFDTDRDELPGPS